MPKPKPERLSESAWLPALLYWGPLVILMSVCVTALSLFVHRQWAHHEQLSYPLAQVGLRTSSKCQEKNGRTTPMQRPFRCTDGPIRRICQRAILTQDSYTLGTNSVRSMTSARPNRLVIMMAQLTGSKDSPNCGRSMQQLRVPLAANCRRWDSPLRVLVEAYLSSTSRFQRT